MIEILTNQYRQFDKNLAQKYSSVELDLGCGNGSFTIGLAQLYPNKLIIGVDIKLGRLRKVAKKAIRNGIDNIFLIRSMVWDIATYYFPDIFFKRVHILCPDPCPKARHRHNRLLSSQFLGQLSTKIVPNGCLHFSTDDHPYLEEFSQAVQLPQIYRKNQTLLNDIKHLKTDFQIHWESLGKSVTHLAYQKV